MRNLAYVFSFLLLLSCSEDPEMGITVCPDDSSSILVLNVDYTTNAFLGGSFISLDKYVESVEMECDYKAPGDFGSITWYDKLSEKKLFSGTIVWMGKGEQTFPETIIHPDDFMKSNVKAKIPDQIVYLPHDESDIPESDIDYTPIWNSIENLSYASGFDKNIPVYIYLYRPSEGSGSPEDCYWVIFFKIN